MNSISARSLPCPVSRVTAAVAVAVLALTGCRHAGPNAATKPAVAPSLASSKSVAIPAQPVAASATTSKSGRPAKRFSYTPRPYPVDERGFSPVDKALAKAYAREEIVADDAEGALNPYVLYKALPQVKRYSQQELIRAMDLLLKCNQRLVSSGLDEALVLQQTLVQIAQSS